MWASAAGIGRCGLSSGVRAHLIQMDIVWEDRAANLATAERLVREADPAAGDLVVLPEMFDTGFSLNVERTADVEGTTLAWVERVARERAIYVQGARTVRTGGKAQNRATIAGPEGVLCEYAKVHPFSIGRESERFEGGGEVVTYEWRAEDQGLRVCPAVCYDLRFPELFRLGLDRGAQMFAVGANWPRQRQEHWRALLIARAIENQAYVVGVNRCGRDPHVEYAGGSIAIDPRGRVMGEMADEEGFLSVDLDPGEVERWREAFPALRDRRL